MSEAKVICPHSRREAIAYYRGPVETIPWPVINVLEISKLSAAEKLQLDEDIKTPYYGVLGKLIEDVIDQTITGPLKRPRPGLRIPAIGRFARLDADMSSTLGHNLDEVLAAPRNSESVSKATELHTLRRALKANRHPNLRSALNGGAGTAIFSSLQLLQLYVGKGDIIPPSAFISTARKSYAPLIQFASSSVAQAIALGDLFETRQMPPVAYDRATGRFVFETSPFEEKVAARTVIKIMHENFDGLSQIKDLVGASTVIGCPILFKPKQLEVFWNWTIDQAVARGLV